MPCRSRLAGERGGSDMETQLTPCIRQQAGSYGEIAFQPVDLLQPGKRRYERREIDGAWVGLFPAKASPTNSSAVHTLRLGQTSTVGPASAGKPLPLPLPLPLLLLLIFKHIKHRRRQTRLGCRLNAGLAQWVEPHGCGESAVRAWMPVRRGPTERDRSEGTRRRRAKPGAGTLGYLGCCFQVTRRRRNSLPLGRRS